MARKYSVKSRYYRKSPWSHENKGVAITSVQTVTNQLYQNGAVIVPAINTQGERTVGNFTITIPVNNNTNEGVIYWALVYVPQGTAANNLFNLTQTLDGSLYEPNQYVIASGVSDNMAGPIRIRSSMKRKLHSGDFISLIIGSTAQLGTVYTLVSYSIKYN